MGTVFISYESSDKNTAFKVLKSLEDNGIKCWIAPRDIGAGDYAGALTRAIKSSSIMVVVCSSSTSGSSHVRNEVSLGFENKCCIIPFIIDCAKLDDSLTYYFAGKQHIEVNNGLDAAFDDLRAIILGNQTKAREVKKNKKKKHRWLISLLSMALLVIAGLVLFNGGWLNKANLTTEPDTFSGTVVNGYPHGVGVYTFNSPRRIDMHDEKCRMAEKGDYIEGEWDDGHLIAGSWFDSKGKKKAVLLFSKVQNTDMDKEFLQCEKR